MSRTLTLRAFDVPSINKFGIGFDSMMTELMRITAQQQTNYPPYNIVQQSEDSFYIELAVAGFDEGQVKIELSNRLLSIRGRIMRDEEVTVEYVHRGISSRDFDREFTLADHVEVTGAAQKNGILTVYLKRTVPEYYAPKTIDINFDQ